MTNNARRAAADIGWMIAFLPVLIFTIPINAVLLGSEWIVFKTWPGYRGRFRD